MDPLALDLLRPEERKALLRLDPVTDAPRDQEHVGISRKIREKLESGEEEGLTELVIQAAYLRRFLG